MSKLKKSTTIQETNSFITSEDLFNRLNSDSIFNKSKCYINHYDACQDKYKDVSLCSWKPVKKGGDIPWHRVYYIKYENHIIWDRNNKVCKIEELYKKLSSNEIKHLPEEFNILTYNVLTDKYEKDDLNRLDDIISYLHSLFTTKQVDIICLQEVSCDMLEKLKDKFVNIASTNLKFANVVFISQYEFPSFEIILLGPEKQSLVININDDFVIVCVHLISNQHGNSDSKRNLQMSTLVNSLPKVLEQKVIFVGDFNTNSSFDSLNLYSESKIDGYTYDPLNNKLAAKHSSSGKQAVYDRLFHNTKIQTISSIVYDKIYLSDHYPVNFKLTTVINDQNDNSLVLNFNKYVLAILPPFQTWQLLNDSNPKWMPHLTLFHPFLEFIDKSMENTINEIFIKYKNEIIEVVGLDFFAHDKCFSVFAKLSNSSFGLITKLQNELSKEFGIKTERFTPHISYCKVDEIIEAEKICSQKLHFQFKLTSLNYLINCDTYYKCETIFGNSTDNPLSILQSNPNLKVLVGGSRIFNDFSGDFDLVVRSNSSREDFIKKYFKLFNQLFDDVVLVQNEHTHYIKIRLDEEYDVHYCGPNVESDIDYAAISVYAASKFIQDLKFPQLNKCLNHVKKLMKITGIYGRQYGYLSGISISVMVANYLIKNNEKIPEAQIDEFYLNIFANDFCDFYSNYDFSTPIKVSNYSGPLSLHDFIIAFNPVVPYENTCRTMTRSIFERIKSVLSSRFQIDSLSRLYIPTIMIVHCDNKKNMKLFVIWWNTIFLSVLLKLEKLLTLFPSNDLIKDKENLTLKFTFYSIQNIKPMRGIWESMEIKIKHIFGVNLYLEVTH